MIHGYGAFMGWYFNHYYFKTREKLTLEMFQDGLRCYCAWLKVKQKKEV